ncbi:MAG: FAD-dependent oxidoreductase [Pseudomonadales bacterium]|nr:FAD-dependent oxidoreductase [Pseudomonadales bacterium]
MDNSEYDIVVIGGGPAGSTIARQLARYGYRVCLLEKSRFPRNKVGESLPPGILPVLDSIGLRSRIENAGFLRPSRARVVWSAGTDELRNQAGEPGFQVCRAKYDAILLDEAVQCGVQVMQPVQIESITKLEENHWMVTFSLEGTHHRDSKRSELRARFLVDASGKKGVLKSLVSGRMRRLSPATLALYGYWSPGREHSIESRIEAGNSAWFWGAVLPDGRINKAVFVSANSLQIQRDERKHEAITRLYLEKLAESRLLHRFGSKCLGPVVACNASSYIAEQSVGDDFIRVGEAGLAIDPLSSQGVQTAMNSAIQGAIVVHTLLQKPEARDQAKQFFEARQAETAQRNMQWSKAMYADQNVVEDSEFWRQRAHYPVSILPDTGLKEDPRFAEPNNTPLSFDVAVKLSDRLVIEPTPVISQNVITERAAAAHPALPRPVAFLEQVELVPLLATVVAGEHLGMIVRRWTNWMPLQKSLDIVLWLWRHHILVPV